jgi:DUF177 domain-containing protein
MQTPSFVVRLADLERGPKQVAFTLSEEWLSRELSDAHAVPLGPGTATLELMKTGATVMVRGSAQVKLTVPCVVTLDPVPLELAPEIFLELAREPDSNDRGKGAGKSPTKPAPGLKPKPIKAKSSGKSGRRGKDDPELTAEEAAYDTFKGEEIVLDGFIREFILLEIPLYPRRSDLPSSEESLSSRPLEGPPAEDKPIDPRLMPLMGLANRLRGAANKE